MEPFNLLTLFMARLRVLKRLTSTKCTPFRQNLIIAFPESGLGFELEIYGNAVRRTADFAKGPDSRAI